MLILKLNHHMSKTESLLLIASLPLLAAAANPGARYDYSNLQRENLGRGLVVLRQSPDSVMASWRFLSSDSDEMGFNVYRDGKKINQEPITDVTWLKEKNKAKKDALYEVRDASTGETLDRYTLKAGSPVGYLNIPLNIPAPGVTPAGQEYTYHANDASVGDVDGDGRFEIILKWEPSNAHDNSHDGYTGSVLFDCYTLDGEQLWRIDLGKNIRAGAHYTQFMVYDLDGDGRAEVVMKTADGTTDGTGKTIGDTEADYREPGDPVKPRGGDFPPGDPRGKPQPGDPVRNQGRILTGPEYLTVFDGATGAELQTVSYIPPRGILEAWGDGRANRSDRFLATVAYLDGLRPSVVMCRGYYTRSVLAAFDWDGKELTTRWVFDSDWPGNGAFAGQGNHNLRTADVDGDGCDEIIYGQMAIDHDGKGLYSTCMGHGDSMHLTSFIPNDNSLQVWGCHENKRDGSSFRDAATGEVLWQVPSNMDVGRCMAADIDPTSYGLEMWAATPGDKSGRGSSGGIRNYKGEVINPNQRTVSMNSAVWWTGDLNRELLDKNFVTKYDPATGRCEKIVEFEGAVSNNGTKANACLSGDIVGDWREEVLLRTPDNSALRLYVTPYPTSYRFHTFLEDIPYRNSIATQNVAYNQPTQVGFYFGSDLQKGKRFRGSIIK